MTNIFSRLIFFFYDTATTEIYTLSLHDALPIYVRRLVLRRGVGSDHGRPHHGDAARSEEHTSELQSLRHLECRLLLEKKKQPQQPRERGRKHTIDRTAVKAETND